MIAPPKPPAQDELELLIKEARERQLRRRLVGAAGVAIVAAVGLGVYALAVGDGDHASPTGRSAGAGAPLCRSSQLSSTAGLNGEAFGTMGGTVVLTNRSAVACSFPTGRPHVAILWRGRVLPTREAAQPTSGRTIPVLGPHSGAAIDMDWSNGCGRVERGPLADPIFRLSWPSRLMVDVPNGVAVRPRCNAGRISMISVGRPYRNRLLAP